MKYFRTYPWALQMALFLLMTLTFMSFVGVIVQGLFTKITGFNAAQLISLKADSPTALINAAVWTQGAGNLFVFMVPALVFAYLAHPRPAAYLGLRAPGKAIQPLLAVLLVLGASPILMLIENLVGRINFGADVKAAQLASEQMTAAFMNMPTFAAFLRTFVVVAIVPALGEEMFFRGVTMRFAKQKSGTMVLPIIFTAVVFSYSHTNIYGYLSIFLAGVLLAVIYNLTGSLWCSILAHMAFNGTQIVLAYLGNTNAAVHSFMASDTVPYYLVAAGALVFAASLYLLLRNKTPLPANWADDFTPEELVLYKGNPNP